MIFETNYIVVRYMLDKQHSGFWLIKGQVENGDLFFIHLTLGIEKKIRSFETSGKLAQQRRVTSQHTVFRSISAFLPVCSRIVTQEPQIMSSLNFTLVDNTKF